MEENEGEQGRKGKEKEERGMKGEEGEGSFSHFQPCCWHTSRAGLLVSCVIFVALSTDISLRVQYIYLQEGVCASPVFFCLSVTRFAQNVTDKFS